MTFGSYYKLAPDSCATDFTALSGALFPAAVFLPVFCPLHLIIPTLAGSMRGAATDNIFIFYWFSFAD